MTASTNPDFIRGDQVRFIEHNHGLVGKVMAVADGYAMVRYPRAMPFIAPVGSLRHLEDDE